MSRFSVRIVIVAVLFIIHTQAYNVDKLLKEHFGEEDVDETEPTGYLRQQGVVLDGVEPYNLGDTLNIPPSEINALHDLYNALHGDDWAWVNVSYVGIPWNFSATANPCADHWQGISCTTEITNTTEYLNVEGIKLTDINLWGTIPETIGNLTQLRILNFLTNAISGTIPEAVYTLSQLTFLDFGYNFMNGTISNDIAKCPGLTVLTLNNNNFTGPLPERLSEITGMTQLTLNNNEFIGTIPASYGNLNQLTILNIGYNFLVGTIPASLGQLTQLTQLAVNKNYFDGTLPDSFANLVALNVIYLDYNGFYGPVPEYFSTYSALIYLIMDENYFSGPIPASLAQLTACTHLYMHTNDLTGTIPPELGSMTQLTLIDFHGNKLTGTIPPELGNLVNLGVLDLFTNLFTGTVPAELGGLALIQSMDFSQNYITGTIPPSLGNLSTCLTMKMHETPLSGSIPTTFGNLASVLYLSFHSNHHTGTIPSSIARLTYLNSFFMYSNMFTGNIADFIDPTMQNELAIVQVSNNQFTGQIPDSLFALPKLQTVALVSNCFSGTIPPVICNSTTLKTLSLDGLRSAPACQKLIFPDLFESYVLKGNIKAGIPACLFEMPSLNTLHLSGNGLTGTLPSNVHISPNLVDISLSHNRLDGSIPHRFQERVWFNLDLSYNKFEGTLISHFASVLGNLSVLQDLGLQIVNDSSMEYVMPTAALSLRNNRLSDTLPSQVIHQHNLSVLEGNLFSCDLRRTNLPDHDQGKNTYQCGSNSFDVSYYVYIVTLGVVVIIALALYYWRKHIVEYIDVVSMLDYAKKWIESANFYDQDSVRSTARLHGYKYVLLVCDNLAAISLYCTLFILFVMLPVYSILSVYYGTHTFEYAWAVSAAYLNGVVSLRVLLALFSLFLVLLLYLFRETIYDMRRFVYKLPKDFHFSVLDVFGEDEVEELMKKNRYTSFSDKLLVYAAFFSINVIVVAGVNIAYVYAALYVKSVYLTLAQILLSIFKIIWGNFGSIYLIRWTHHYLASSATKDWKNKSVGFFTIQLFVSLFNFILVPCVVVACISPDCLNNVVVPASTVSAYYYYKECTLFTVLYGCQTYTPRTATTSYSPPFTYSYECSSSLITFYAPTFVYMGFIAAFLCPLWDMVMQRAHRDVPRDTWLYGQIHFWVPVVLHHTTVESSEKDLPYDIFNPYFDANYILVCICSYLGVLLTFGFVFPPLAVVMLVTIYSIVWDAKLKVGRFLHNAIELNIHKYTDVIDGECHGVGSVPKLYQCLRLLIVFACLFYTPFLFDILGDSVGVNNSIWVIIVVPLLPLTFPPIYVAYKQYYKKQYGRTGSQIYSRSSIELRDSNFLRSAHAEQMLNAAMTSELKTIEHPGTLPAIDGHIAHFSNFREVSGESDISTLDNVTVMNPVLAARRKSQKGGRTFSIA